MSLEETAMLQAAEIDTLKDRIAELEAQIAASEQRLNEARDEWAQYMAAWQGEGRKATVALERAELAEAQVAALRAVIIEMPFLAPWDVQNRAADVAQDSAGVAAAFKARIRAEERERMRKRAEEIVHNPRNSWPDVAKEFCVVAFNELGAEEPTP